MSTTTTAFSPLTDEAHDVRLFANGAEVGTAFAATIIGTGTHCYSITIPNTTPAGHYAFGMYDTATGTIRSTGEFAWNGSSIEYPATTAPTLRPVIE